MNTIIKTDSALKPLSTPRQILQAGLKALGDGEFSEAIDQFDDHFTFKDEALGLEFTDKGCLSDFLQKSRELFPGTVLKVISFYECEDHVIAEWRITATQIVPYGSLQLRIPISFPGTSVVRTENGRITRWSDYYDQSTSRRVNLAAFFTEWPEY